MSKNFYIADLHFGHENILAYDNRPFSTIDEHDKYLIDAWNMRVSADDDVYILGDVSWHPLKETVEIIQSLKGNKHLIKGNHDSTLLGGEYFADCFVEITPYKELQDCGKDIVLCHYPIVAFNGSHCGAWHLYGHVHTSFEENMVQHYRMQLEDLYQKEFNMLNVGAMMPYMNYQPRMFDEIIRHKTCHGNWSL